MVKKQQMRWTPRGAHLLLQVRTRVLNDDLADQFRRWHPGFTHTIEGSPAGLAVAAYPPPVCSALPHPGLYTVLSTDPKATLKASVSVAQARPVVAAKFLLSRWGRIEGARSFVACSFDQPDAVPGGVELRERAEVVRKASPCDSGVAAWP